MTSFAINNQYSNFNQNYINGTNGNDVCFIDNSTFGNIATFNGGNGFDTAIINGSPADYSQGLLFENFQLYRTFTDQRGNLIKINSDVENIQFTNNQYQDYNQQQNYPQDPFIAQLSQWFNSFMANFANAANQNGNTGSTGNTSTGNNTTTNPNTNTSSSLPAIDAKEALKTIMDNFDICDTASGGGDIDGQIGRGDLEIIANSSGLDPKLRAAAKFLLDNKAVFSSVYAHSSPFMRGKDRIDKLGLMQSYSSFGGIGTIGN